MALVAATATVNARRAWPEAACRWAAGHRQIVEQVIAPLKDLFALERHRAKTLGGLLARLAAKVLWSVPVWRRPSLEGCLSWTFEPSTIVWDEEPAGPCGRYLQRS